MRIKISALDTLFFRDGKPFSRGEETWANGIFPPPPSVIYGALRSLYFVSHPDHIGKGNSENDPTKKLVISDIQITSEENTFYPCPYDVVAEKATIENSTVNYLMLNLTNQETISSSNLAYRLLVEDNKEIEALDGYISRRSFLRKYLNGQKPTETYPLTRFLTLEPKVGIGRDNHTHVSQDGLLYRVGMIRPAYQEEATKQLHNLNIEVEFDLPNWKLPVGHKGFIKLGGESKACSFEVILSKERIAPQKISSEIFKVYFTTPTIFSNKNKGWIPNFLDENLEGTWNGVKIKLLTAALGKPKYLGGFDMKERKPKPLLKMIPEGSVYYFKVIEGDIKSLENLKQPFKLIDSEEKAIQGFGLAYLATI